MNAFCFFAVVGTAANKAELVYIWERATLEGKGVIVCLVIFSILAWSVMIAKAVQAKQMHPVSAIFDIIESMIEPGTSVNIPLPGNIKLKLSSKQLHTLVNSADIVIQGLTRRRK